MISVVVNTFNSAKNIKCCLDSVKKWADEIIIVDMESDDETIEIVQKYTSKIYTHPKSGYVEPARNFAISKASGDWVFILDTDEEAPRDLLEELKKIADQNKTDLVEIPRQNIIFNKWMQASFWWPDYNIRFFKKGNVQWNSKIHSKPETTGIKETLSPEKELAIIHYNYQTVSQFIQRMDNYSSIQARELYSDGVEFRWVDLIAKPLDEFLSRFFANKGFEDGIHGLVLSLLQAFSFLIIYVKLWELEKFEQQEISIENIAKESNRMGDQINYWLKMTRLSKNPFKRVLQKAKNKFL